MKRKLMIGYIGTMIALVISTTAMAQFAFSKMPSRKAAPFYMRLITENVSDPTYYSNSDNPHITNITTRALRHFLINFNEVANETWYCTQNMFVAIFTLNDINYRVDYDKKGEWIETLRTYAENKMSPQIREIVKSSYPDYEIFLVQEIEMPLHPTNYVVHLEGKTRWINLVVYDRDIQQWEKLIKSE